MTAQRSDAGPGPARADGKPARRTTNDIELIADVIRCAMTTGYVLIGPAQRAFRRVEGERKGGRVDAVPGYEQDAVHQLLGSKHLRIGGTHIVRYGRRESPASFVRVPESSRAMVTRWAAYKRLH